MNIKKNIAVNLFRLLASTWRIKVKGVPDSPAVVVFWHGQMLPAWKVFSGKNPRAVVSMSKDGQILSDLLEKWGFTLIRGSSSKGGKEVLDNATEAAKEHYLLMTPDGPRGPIYEFKAGAVVAAMRSGAPLYLCSVKNSSEKIFEKSWDKFKLPLPFAKIEIEYSDPINIPSSATREEVDAIIKEAQRKMREMNNIQL
ncbi:MAG: lysophospholipid acyltransferase family protein [Candidatus Kapabacteria bacterium]|jgi:lysophospholipid acyltransferase (LPLAT)-like uncharacterized protein|nr:lysophospholipid acyltransferase family protein [Candidatus Kapabacteria bacterium]